MNKKCEFSKIMMSLVMLTYFVGLLFGILMIVQMSYKDKLCISTALCGLFSYIAAPVSVSIGFYSSKAKAENVEKIRGNSN